MLSTSAILRSSAIWRTGSQKPRKLDLKLYVLAADGGAPQRPLTLTLAATRLYRLTSPVPLDPAFDLTSDGKENLFYFFLFADAFGSTELAKLLAVAEAYLGVPLTAQLAQNHPNPFNSETAIEYELPQSGENTAHDIRRHGPAGRDVGQWVTCCRDLRPAVGRT